MQAMLGPALCSALAWRVQPAPEGVAVDVFEPGAMPRDGSWPAPPCSRRPASWRTGCSAAPRTRRDSYAPWMVANVTVGRMPAGRGAPLCWDNVIYGSRSLGYVVATHQSLQQVQRRTVLTYYWPLSDQPPDEARRAALARTLSEWQAMVLAELLPCIRSWTARWSGSTCGSGAMA